MDSSGKHYHSNPAGWMEFEEPNCWHGITIHSQVLWHDYLRVARFDAPHILTQHGVEKIELAHNNLQGCIPQDVCRSQTVIFDTVTLNTGLSACQT